MDETPDSPPLAAAPRHLRRRYFREEIPDTFLVPGAEPVALSATPPSRKADSGLPKQPRSKYQRKRLVALVIVVVVTLSIPALILALVLAG